MQRLCESLADSYLRIALCLSTSFSRMASIIFHENLFKADRKRKLSWSDVQLHLTKDAKFSVRERKQLKAPKM